MQEVALSACYLVIGIIFKSKKLSFLIISLTLLTSMVRLLNLDQFIYCTVVIFIYAAHYKFVKNPFLRLSISILIFYYLVSFSLSAIDALFAIDAVWQLVLTWFNLYQVFYFCTITLIFAGLAMGDQGGHRVNRAGFNLFYASDNSTNNKRL
tara:strand:- start:1226 stop:1681 length:456 start_codon:yes stop_codon:yes gene_type:complete